MRARAPTAALLPLAAEGDADIDVHAALYDAWGPTVLRWCTRLGGPRVPAEDAAQDVFERVLGRLHTVRSMDAFPAWLFQTTRRVVRDHLRRAWLRRWVPGFVLDVPDPADDPRRHAERSETTERVQDALDALPAALREVIVLSEIEERDGPEVAALLGVPLGTVKSRLRRGREAFAREARARGLAPDGEPEVASDLWEGA